MKILRLSAMGLAAAVGCAIGCGGSSCGGTNINANTNSSTVICGPGTQQQGNVCVLANSVNSK